MRTNADIPVRLYIDRHYEIHLGGICGPKLLLRPLVRSIYILFLKHPEGICLKQRDAFRQELEDIYGTIAPGVSGENVRQRIMRLVSIQDNSFSEKASVLNATLERTLPRDIVHLYKIQGMNGCPRKILLDPILVQWE